MKTPLGKFIAKMCREKGITQAELSRRIGTHKAYINALCSGNRCPSRKMVKLIEKELDIEEGTIERMMRRMGKGEDEYDGAHVASPREKRILEVWNRGEKTPKEVARITGYSIKTVGIYLPLE